MNIMMTVITWEFDHPSSCEVLNLVVVGWSVFSLCPLRSQPRYWRKYSGLSMKFYGSLWWRLIRPKFVVGDGKLWLRYGWIFYSSYSVIVFSFFSSKNSSSSTSASSLFCYICVSISWVPTRVFSIGFIWSYWSSK